METFDEDVLYLLNKINSSLANLQVVPHGNRMKKK